MILMIVMKTSPAPPIAESLSGSDSDRESTNNVATAQPRSWFQLWLLATYSVAYAVTMLALGGTTLTKLYAPSPYHRLQADALLNGRLNLADSIYQIDHDLAWHDGQVNHVWGLGVGLWLLPFEFVWRLFGQTWFPDRVALGVAFALLAWYSGITALKLLENRGSPTLGIGCACLVMLSPALWTLAQGPQLIYEETSMYACLVSLGILITVVRVACFGRRTDYLICVGLAALSALVRPTHGIYGLVGLLVCSAVLIARQRWFKTVILGNMTYLLGLVLLAGTNWVRFGSPTEFGHRLTATPDMIVFMTRIDNPMREASLTEAGRELFGALFFMGDISKERVLGERLIPGQSPHARWRDPYLTTYDLSWLFICMAAVVGTGVWIWWKTRHGWTIFRLWQRADGPLLAGTVVWAGLSAVALVWFYVRFPNFSARYLLDFAPAFTGFGFLCWFGLSRRWSWFGLAALAGWLGYELLTIQIRQPPHSLLTRAQISTQLPRADGRKIEEFAGKYTHTITNHPAATMIPYNGSGWNQDNGQAGAIVILALDRPNYIEMVVDPCQDRSKDSARPDLYRAKIDNQFLAVREVRKDGDQLRIRFDLPEAIRRRAGHEMLFLCFTRGFDQEDRQSKRLLHSVRWRQENDDAE